MTTIGDLGCPGIDVDKWREANRAPLFPGKVNRWVLARTTRDNPTPDDLRRTLAATFVKWFEGTPVDPVLSTHGTTRSGAADLIRLERASTGALFFPHTAKRREDLAGPLPLLKSGGIVYLEVSFAYRGLVHDMPWPVRTGTTFVQLQSSAQCPIDADWILDSVAVPGEDAPPKQSSSEKAGDVISETTRDASSSLLGALWLPLTVLVAGLLLVILARR